MLYRSLLLMFNVALISIVNCFSHGDWFKNEDVLPAFVALRTTNIIRCEKLCERQSKCVAVTYDTTQMICFMHDEDFNPDSSNRGKYLYSSAAGRLQKLATTHKCQDSEIYLATLEGGGSCRNIQLEYLGCFLDKSPPDRDLELRQPFPSTNSKKVCLSFCASKGFKYFGLQNGGVCWCSDSYGKHGQIPESRCSSDCNGNVNEKCGGPLANSIYATGL